MNIKFFKEIEKSFILHGVKSVYIKHLAPKQDNDKNQIYLGNGLDGVTNLFPADLNLRELSQSTRKRKSNRGRYIIEAALDFYWLQDNNSLSHAPHTKIIDYFQYPEVRMSGFLRGSINPPDSLRRINQHKYGKRILILGVTNNKTIGLVVNQLEDPVVENFPDFPPARNIQILRYHQLRTSFDSTPESLLLQELKNISGVWHKSCTLDSHDSIPRPFKGTPGPGYTLEALLGIPRNSKKLPDKYGYEIKSFKKGGKISLMTPTADRGEEGNLSFKDFMEKYGWKGKRGDGRIVFNGVHRYHKLCKNTGLILKIFGLNDNENDFIEETIKILVFLENPTSKQIVSGWSFEKLLKNWEEKHNSACFVKYEKKPYTGSDGAHDYEYKFTGDIFITDGTTLFKYLMAVAKSVIYYDSAHEISASGEKHARPQWRIGVNRKLIRTLSEIYNQVKEINLLD